MGSITVSNLDDGLKQPLRVRDAQYGRSIDEEARATLREAAGETEPRRDLTAAIRARIAALGGVELNIPPREGLPDPRCLD